MIGKFKYQGAGRPFEETKNIPMVWLIVHEWGGETFGSGYISPIEIRILEAYTNKIDADNACKNNKDAYSHRYVVGIPLR